MAIELVKNKTMGEGLAISAEVIFNNLGGLPENHIHRAGLAFLTLKKAILEYINLQREPWKKAYKNDNAFGKINHRSLIKCTAKMSEPQTKYTVALLEVYMPG